VSGRQPIELASGAIFGSDDNKFNYGTDSTLKVHHPQIFFSLPPASAPLLLESLTSVPQYTMGYPHSAPADPGPISQT
jgi:hypothetical protein